MRDKSDPETIAYLEAENAYTKSQTAHLATLREQIFDEIKLRTQETDLSVPSRSGPFWYYNRTAEGSQYPLLCRTPIAAPGRLDPAVARARRRRARRADPGRLQRSWPRARTSSRSAPSRCRSTPTCSPTRPTRPATSATRSTSRTCAPASSCRRDPQHVARRHLVPRRATTSSTRRSTMPGGRTRSGGTRSAPTLRTTYSSITRRTTASGRRWVARRPTAS